LINNSIADTLHRHSELVASDGSPDPAVSVDAVGNVGIGTTAPGAKLDVAGNIKITGEDAVLKTDGEYLRRDSAGTINFDAQGGYIFNIDTNNNDTSTVFGVRSNAGTTNLVTIQQEGDVGIGTVNPNFLLHAYSDATGPSANIVSQNSNAANDAAALVSAKSDSYLISLRAASAAYTWQNYYDLRLIGDAPNFGYHEYSRDW